MRGTETGYGSTSRAIKAARFSLRIRSCSGKSSSALEFEAEPAVLSVLIGWQVYRLRHFAHELDEVQSTLNQAHGAQLFLKHPQSRVPTLL